MKSSTILLAVSSVASLGAAKPVRLVVGSSNTSLSGKGLSPIHFGAGINGVLLSDSVQEFQADESNLTLYQNIETGSGPFRYYFTQAGDALVTEPGETNVHFDTGFELFIRGSSSKFFACTNLSYDPYGYTTTQHEIGVGIHDANDYPATCTPITILVEGFKSPVSSSSVASSLINKAPGSQTPYYGNTTTATTTKYTTIPCDYPTTLVYNSHTFTVTSATTLTVEDCGCNMGPTQPGGPIATAPPQPGGPIVTGQNFTNSPNGTTSPSGVPAPPNSASTTVDVTRYTTIPCSTPTTVTYNSQTYTVSSATTLTVEDCGCSGTGSAQSAPIPQGSVTAPAPEGSATSPAPEASASTTALTPESSSSPIAPAPNVAAKNTLGIAVFAILVYFL